MVTETSASSLFNHLARLVADSLLPYYEIMRPATKHNAGS
jgi:hypothetical protein